MQNPTFWTAVFVALNIEATLANSLEARVPSVDDRCSSELITKLCDYKDPALGTSVAASSRNMCADYCDQHAPCDFFIFHPGNPYDGSGSCAFYPNEQFDPAQGTTTGCGSPYLEVFGKPTCSRPVPAPTGTETLYHPAPSACAATASPSAVANICDYPSPPDNCFYSCAASSGASSCLSQCASRPEGCGFVIYNALNENGSPYQDGNCWMYPVDWSYEEAKATKTCADGAKPTLFVYENKCPKPTQSSTSAAVTGSAGTSEATGASGSGSGAGSTTGAVVVGAAAAAAATGTSTPATGTASGVVLSVSSVFALAFAVMLL